MQRIFSPVGWAYVGLFALFFWGIHGGVGQFWDWSFPYFSDHLQNLFTSKSTSWTSANQGSPLGYSSDYFVRFCIALFGYLHIPPELVRYGLMVGIFAASAYGVYLIARKHTTAWVAFLIGLVTLINPAIFYKYTAGHFNYLLAFMLFIYLVYYLITYYQPRLRSAVIVGLFMAFMGAQIQFFVIGFMFLFIYFAFNRQSFRWRHACVVIALTILINLVWLANFIVGAASAGDIGAAAAKVSFKSLSGSDFLSVFTFSFAKATLLTKFYALYELLWNAALFVLLLWLLVREKNKQLFDVILLVFLALMIFMATGLFQLIPLGPVTMLYPMLREVGHFAPLIVLATLLLMARLVQTSRWRWALTTVLVGSLCIVGLKFQVFSQAYSFADVRQQFAPFKEFADADSSDYRIVAYPFFDQYSFNKLAKDPVGIMPLKNSGHDSFAAFSSQHYVNNAIPPHKFQESPQYRLLQSYDIDVLRPYNVKYIFDFSDIYESNYEKYVPPTVYNNDLALIKNDAAFFDKLLAANPGELRRVNDKVLEIIDMTPRVAANDTLYRISDKDTPDSMVGFTPAALGKTLDYVTNGDSTDNDLDRYTTGITPLFGNGANIDPKTNSARQTVRKSGNTPSSLYIDRGHDTVFYRTEGESLVIYTKSTGTLTLDDKALYESGGERIIGELPLGDDTQYYASFKGKTIKLTAGNSGRLGLGEKGDSIDLFTASSDNVIQNPSFEDGLWREKVDDCNNYDYEHRAKLGMRTTTDTASHGRTSLELEAERHDACTYTTFTADANSEYLLSYDYQSPNAKTTSFYMAYENKNKDFARASQTIRDTSWDAYTTLVKTPDQQGKARLYFYALEQQDEKIINRYDNVQLVKLQRVDSITVPGATVAYDKINLPSDSNQQFAVTDANQTYRNLLANPSFEQGPWQRKVSDCRNYDANGDIGMRIRDDRSTDGKQSLELRATRHDACVRTTTDITAETDYQFTFDFRGEKGKNYAYAVSFDDPLNTIRRKQGTIKSSGSWETASFRIKAPVRASTITVYLYAPEAGDKTPNVIGYDNVRLTELPDYVDRFFVVSEPNVKLSKPRSIEFEDSITAAKQINIKGATTPFFLSMSETYHAKWRLTSDGKTISPHYQTNAYGNGWFIDPASVCTSGATCTKHDDGSYDMTLAADFTPQRWFTLFAAISWLTIAGCAAYLTLRHATNEPNYLHTLLKRRKS